MSTPFPDRVEREVALAQCADNPSPQHEHDPRRSVGCDWSDRHAEAVLEAVAPLVRKRVDEAVRQCATATRHDEVIVNRRDLANIIGFATVFTRQSDTLDRLRAALEAGL